MERPLGADDSGPYRHVVHSAGRWIELSISAEIAFIFKHKMTYHSSPMPANYIPSVLHLELG